MSGRPLTGRMVFAITATAFAIIIAVNVTMAVKAVSTFPGLEVKNSYVASQQFDARRAAQQRLGWQIETEYQPGQLALTFTGPDGRSITPQNLSVLIGRTTESQDDIRPTFAQSQGRFVTPLDLQRGKWMLLVEATAQDGTQFRQRLELRVKG